MTDEYFEIPENPEYDPQIRMLQRDDLDDAEETWNPMFLKLISNIHAVKLQQPDLSVCLQFGEDSEAGKFDQLTTAPTETGNPLRYNGTFRATQVRGIYYSDDADVAEMYSVNGEVEPGDLMMVCEDGALRRNDVVGNTRVLGIVSTAPAMVLGDKSGGVPIALAGRVPVKVKGNVRPGDYLVGSATPGVCQAMPIDNARRGSVVAQALEGHNNLDGVGTITAFVVRM